MLLHCSSSSVFVEEIRSTAIKPKAIKPCVWRLERSDATLIFKKGKRRIRRFQVGQLQLRAWEGDQEQMLDMREGKNHPEQTAWVHHA